MKKGIEKRRKLRSSTTIIKRARNIKKVRSNKRAKRTKNLRTPMRTSRIRRMMTA